MLFVQITSGVDPAAKEIPLSRSQPFESSFSLRVNEHRELKQVHHRVTPRGDRAGQDPRLVRSQGGSKKFPAHIARSDLAVRWISGLP
jgi:hypothetical protein